MNSGPFVFELTQLHFRFVIAVKSAESLAMPVAPHQLEPNPPGLMSETLAGLVTLAVKSLV